MRYRRPFLRERSHRKRIVRPRLCIINGRGVRTERRIEKEAVVLEFGHAGVDPYIEKQELGDITRESQYAASYHAT